MITQFTIKRC